MNGDAENPADKLARLTGVEIAGRFRMGRMLGRGGYGAVYDAVQMSMDRRCAVKVLVPNAREDPTNSNRFEREARLTSQLAHPNTVVVYDFGFDREQELLFIAMEHIAGKSLRDFIRDRGQLDVTTTLHIAHQAARSLQDAHEHGLVHRDVKPHNIMVTQRGGDATFVKVIDFGIARYRDVHKGPRVTRTGAVIGTPAYMAPEQVRGQDVDASADQYSLAVCVYQMLTGRTLFQGETPFDIASKHVTQSPIPLRIVAPDLAVDVAFDAALMRALEKNPRLRYPSIRQFADELVRVANVTLPFVVSSDEASRASERRRPPLVIDAEPPTAPLGGVDPFRTTAASEPTTAPLGDEAPTELLAPMPEGTTTAPAEIADGLTLSPPTSETESVPHATVVTTTRERPRPVVFAAVGAAALLAVVAAAVVAIGSSSKAATERVEPKDAPAAERPIVREGTTSDEPPAAADPPHATAPVETPEPAADDAPEPRKPASAKRDASKSTPSTVTTDETPVRRSPAPVDASKRSQPESVARSAPDEQQTEPKREVVESKLETREGVVTVTLVPWGTLVVNGKSLGNRPRRQLTLPAGEHRFELVQDGAVRASKTVDVDPAQPTMIHLIAP